MRAKRTTIYPYSLCYWAVRELGISCTDLAKQLEMTQPGVGYAVSRGEKIAEEHKYQL
ncbi:MAG: hypothetical protein JRE64_10550 [Deltaproteobacteria bacterium]|nr:hypothetical protein [Deltaproteobacteria bacterium]